MEKTKKYKTEKGITLIALIITIIVLLILAGVSIAMLTGENGILSKAQSVSLTQAQSELEETMKLSISESFMYIDEENTIEAVLTIAKNNGYITEEHTITKTKNESGLVTECTITHIGTGATVILKQIVIGGTISLESVEGETGDDGDDTVYAVDTTIKDAAGVDITIPGGFGVPADSAEDPLEDRNTIEKGFVIEDAKGNQFVWVPADFNTNASAIRLKAVESDGTYISTTNSIYSEPKYLTSTSTGDASSYNTIELTEAILEAEFEEMQASVVNRGGFYIMRYEMSYGADGKAESKQGAKAAKPNAETSSMWWGMYSLAKTYTNGNVKSTMIANSQYDILVAWAGATEISASGRNESDTTTGTEPTDKIRNIYDLTGGGYEWTTGALSTEGRVIRGNVYSGMYTATFCQSMYGNSSTDSLSSRATLIW